MKGKLFHEKICSNILSLYTTIEILNFEIKENLNI